MENLANLQIALVALPGRNTPLYHVPAFETFSQEC